MGLQLRLALAALVLLCGCPSDDPPIDSFTILFQLDTEGDAATCVPGVGLDPPLTCGSFPMSCDVRVAIRLLDLPPEQTGMQPLVRDEVCLLLEWNENRSDVCALGDPDFLRAARFEDVRPTRGQVEVTIWRDTPAVANCPLVPYDLAGRPQPQQDDLNPAFGRRIIFDFGGQDSLAQVPLACGDTGSLTEATCAPPTTLDMRADVGDIVDLLSVTEDKAPSLKVRIGQPVPVDGNPNNFQIVPAETFELGLIEGTPPLWRENDVEITPEFDFAEDEDVCVIVTDFFSQPAATCTKITAADVSAMKLQLQGYMVDAETWDTIKNAIGLSDIPSDGLIIGRVVKTSMEPLANVVVTTDPPPILWYINEDLTGVTDSVGVPLTKTSKSGYFVAHGAGAPFRTTWDATGPGNWRIVGTPQTGALNNQTLTVLVIQMTDDLASP